LTLATTSGAHSYSHGRSVKGAIGLHRPKTLAELVQLTPEQRAQLMALLRQSPEVLRADGTLPVEVGLGFATSIKAQSNAAG
jgi:Spy/CpxP family protein refolding chaperone